MRLQIIQFLAVALHEEGLGSDSIVMAVANGRAQIGVSGNSWQNMQTLVKE